MLDYTEDLQFLADKVTDALNIFNKTRVLDNQLIIAYTDKDFIAVTMAEQKDTPEYATLKLRTRDMMAAWKNVPVGFSEINESKGLLSDMKKAAHPSLKKNGLWYIDKQIKDVIGDKAEIAEIASYRGYKYKVKLTNQYECQIILTKNDKEYTLDHDVARLYALYDMNGKQLTDFLSADECLLTLMNMSMMTDIRAAKFIEHVQSIGGKAKSTHAYRLPDESMDEVKAVSPNMYAIQLRISDDDITMDILGHAEGQIYDIVQKTFEDIDKACEFVSQLIQQPQFVPPTDTKNE